MDEALRRTAASLLAAAPASVEMPAGAGKTHLLAAAVAVADSNGCRSLVLTHTNAGVDAIRNRLKKFGVPTASVKVETITSWAFTLSGAYPRIAGVEISAVPDWSLSDEYVAGATRAVMARAIANVHSLSFDYVFVDEYQDCTLIHHEFILSIWAAIPKTIVLGDRLQAIFGFAGDLAEWDGHVLPNFPAFDILAEPQRWKGANEGLGAWLLDIRPKLVEGNLFDFSEHSVVGLNLVADMAPTKLAAVANGFRDYEQTVVLLDKWANDIARHASCLGGNYSVMEDINGNFMRERLNGNPQRSILGLPDDGDPRLAMWFAQFAKACIVGLAEIDDTILRRLDRNKSLDGLRRQDIQSFVNELEQLRLAPTYSQLAIAAQSVRSIGKLRIYRWEAWTDTLKAIALTAENGESPVENLGQVRERLRRQGRKSYARVASRTLLVKGLEYDHVIIADANKLCDPRNLYVALSRAKRSVTVFGANPCILLKNDRRYG